MCGICGIVNFDGQPASMPVLGAMVDVMIHRGPDGHDVRRQKQAGALQVGLGHARLKIIDLSDAAAQPMNNEDGSVGLVFNGEIYNYRELRRQLQAGGASFRTASDTEVILRLYESEGEGCIAKLDGMFAIAIWDARKQQLVLARDRVGKKPLFYYNSSASFIFGSEVKSLLQHPAISADIDPSVLPEFFMFGYVPAPATFYRNIRQLPPGSVLVVRAGKPPQMRRYWSLPVPAESQKQHLSEAEAVKRMRELIDSAVQRRLVADVPLGAFLSGGVDSSIVVATMSRLTSDPVRTFSIGFSGDKRFDETHYARLVAQRFKTVHTEFVVEPSAIDLIDRLVWHHDGPFADSSAVPTFILSRLTRQHVTVALNGDGGDELFAGYPRFYWALVAERVPLWLRRSVRGLLASMPDWGGQKSLLYRLRKFTDAASLPFLERYHRWVSVFYEDLPRLLTGYPQGNRVSDTLASVEGAIPASEGCSLLDKLLALNFNTYLLDDLLVKMDRCSMGNSLEARSPFLDTALIEFVASLPDALKLRGRRTKYLLRKAYADELPPVTLTRGKQGFGAPFGTWFRNDLGDYLSDTLLAPDARFGAYLQRSYVRKLVEEHRRGFRDHGLRLWSVLTFESWLRQLPSWKRSAAVQASIAAGNN